MPFAGYKDFDACVKANSDKDDPKGYCATIMRKVEGASQSETKGDRLYIRRFLLDTSVNLNEWGVSASSIDANIGSFIGKPFVLTENLDHPLQEGESVEHNLAYQEQFRIGTIIDVVKDGTRYDAIIEITNPTAAQEIRSGNVPVYVSPAIVHDPSDNERNIEHWMGIHLAAVDQPAFGVKKTSKASHCDGTKESCLMVLRKAAIEKNGHGNCGFCIKGALQKLVSKNTSSLNSSHVPDTISNASMADNTPTASVSTFTQAQVDELVSKVKGEYEAKIKNIEAELTAKTKTNEELGTRVAAIEKERRTEQISSIITAEIYPKKEDLESVRKQYIENTVPIEVVKATFAPLVATVQKVKKASLNKSIPLASEAEEGEQAKTDILSVLGTAVI